jgi:hypothetical protein
MKKRKAFKQESYILVKIHSFSRLEILYRSTFSKLVTK